MPGPRSPKPAYCLHRRSGRAFVTIDGKQITLPGAHGSQVSRDAYDQIIGEWIARGRQSAPAQDTDVNGGTAGGVTVAQLVAGFWDWCKGYYRDRDGKPADEVENFRLILRPLRRLYGDTLAAEFGPLKLKALRDDVIRPKTITVARRKTNPTTGVVEKVEVEVDRPGWNRRYTNRQIGRIRQVFKWGAENELVPGTVYQALQAVSALKKGKTEARETPAIKPAPAEDVALVLPFLPPPVRAMVEVEAITGMRPGEVRMMRTRDIDRSGDLWVYRPAHHKTEHHGDDHTREIFLGPRAKEIIAPFLTLDQDRYLFRPEDADAWQRERRAETAMKRGRKTPTYPCELRRREQQKRVRAARRRTFADHYSKDAYIRCVRRACQAAGLSKWWTPNRLRHSAATRLREKYGLEAAQVILGHKTLTVTQVYAEQNVRAARRIMAEVG